MPRPPLSLVFHSFGAGDPLDELADETFAKSYLRCYLADLEAAVIIEEPYYFDRDYLAEFAAFYSSSARGYPNICRRLHFFAAASIDRALLLAAAGDDAEARGRLQASYLGFSVLRPFEPARIGRTVLSWYPDAAPPGSARVTEPSRTYAVHLAGVQLKVRGIAWQQQDTSVGACATVALWSMLQSSAFDDHHAVPTTAEITRAAHRHGSAGARVFPSAGLTPQQLGEAVHAHQLSPILLEGDIRLGGVSAFSRERLASTLAAFVRSGYPVLVGGMFWERDGAEGPGHAVCVTGFRPLPPAAGMPSDVVLADGETRYVYLHDDNLGPNVRFELTEESPCWMRESQRSEEGEDESEDAGGADQPAPGVEEPSDGDSAAVKSWAESLPRVAVLTPSPPTPRGHKAGYRDPTPSYPRLIPTTLLVAVHDELRTSPDRLHREGLRLGKRLSLAFSWVAREHRAEAPVLAMSTRFIGVREYMRDELPRLLAGNPAGLARVRLSLLEDVPPMSLHLGLVRFGFGSNPAIDVLYDTTDSELHLKAFATVTYVRGLSPMVQQIATHEGMDLGVHVDGA